MSFDKEWARLKADALARKQQPAHMQLNRLAPPTVGGDTGSGGAADGYAVKADSVDGSSHTLIEIAGVLYEGRMDGENATMCRVPRAHPDVASYVETFARYAQDQFNDTVVLLAALAGKLKSANNAYAQYDEAVRARLQAVLVSGRYVAPQDR